MKIGTHDSATGEPGRGLLSLLVTPWAKTQSKTIREQYEAGARYFDLRIKLVAGEWVLAHGIWISKTKPRDVFEFLNEKGDAVVSITYEGSLTNDYTFLDYCDMLEKVYSSVMLHKANVKKPEWKTLKTYNPVATFQDIIGFNFEHWQIIFGTPRLVNLLFTRHHKYDEMRYTLVDFL